MNKTTGEVLGRFVPDFEKLLSALDNPPDQFEWGKGDINQVIPRRDYHDGSLGVSQFNETVFVYRNSEWIRLEIEQDASWNSNYAYSQPSHSAGQPVGDLLLPGDKFVVINRYERDDWPGRELIDERTLVLWEVGSTLTHEDRLVQWAVEILADRDLSKYFAAASEIQREFDLSESAVRKACNEKRVRCWQLGRDWIVYRPDARERWGNK